MIERKSSKSAGGTGVAGKTGGAKASGSKKAASSKAATKKTARKTGGTAAAPRKAAAKKTSGGAKAPRKAAPPKAAPRGADPREAAPRKSAARRSAPSASRHPLGIYELHVAFDSRRVDDVNRFFREALGFEGDLMTEMQYLMINTHPGGSLGFMDWETGAQMAQQSGAPGPTSPEAAGLYFMTDDVEGVYRTLSTRGVEFSGPPEDMPWGHRVIRTQDPEGRGIVFAQDLNRR
jgi:catechol 2,3-dioxygenase-like lactoylglutathione lyase family enzyme